MNDSISRRKSDRQARLSIAMNDLANARCSLNELGDAEEGCSAQGIYDIVKRIDDAMGGISWHQRNQL